MKDIFKLTEVQPSRQRSGSRRHISIETTNIQQPIKFPHPPKIKKASHNPSNLSLPPSSLKKIQSPLRPSSSKRASNIRKVYHHVKISDATRKDDDEMSISSGSYQMDRQALLAQMHPDLLATLSEDNSSVKGSYTTSLDRDDDSISILSSRKDLNSPSFPAVSVTEASSNGPQVSLSPPQKLHRRSLAVPNSNGNIAPKQENRRVSLAFPKAANLLSSKAKGLLFLQSRRASLNPNKRNPSSRRTSMKVPTANTFNLNSTEEIEEPPSPSPTEQPHTCTNLSLEGQYVLLRCYEDVLVHKLSKIFPGTWQELGRCRSPSLRGNEIIDREEMTGSISESNSLNLKNRNINSYEQALEENDEIDDLFGIHTIKGSRRGKSARSKQRKSEMSLVHVPPHKLQLSLRFKTATDLLDALKLDPDEPIVSQNKSNEKWIENLVHHPLKHFSKWSNTWPSAFPLQTIPDEQLMLQNKKFT